MFDLVTLGEALIGLDSAGRRLESAQTLVKSIGGAEANTAIGLSRLGYRTALIGRVGDDPLGREVTQTLRGEGVDVQHLITDPSRPTGLMIKERIHGRVAVHYYRHQCAGSALDVADIPDELIAGASALHLTGITMALGQNPRKALLAATDMAHDAGVAVSLDANFRHKLCGIEELVSHFKLMAPRADHILLSWSEAVVCAGSDSAAAVREYVRALSASTVVVKGPDGGATAYVDGDEVAQVDPVTVDVVDPVGAGDGFAVGYLHGLLSGSSVKDGLDLGARIAGRVVSHVGDYEGLPFARELAPDSLPRPGVER